MIPAEAYARVLRLGFGMMAARRGPHWALTSSQVGTEKYDEAELLADAIAGVMKHVPLPDRELGLVGDIGALAMAGYMVLGPRIEADRLMATGQLPPGQVTRSQTAPPKTTQAPTAAASAAARPPAAAPTAGPQTGVGDAAAQLEAMGDAPIAARAQGQVVGPVPIQQTPRDPDPTHTDPEVTLFERTQPVGAEAAQVGELVTAYGADEGHPLLERLAPAPEIVPGTALGGEPIV